jgi:hypothetical protein
MTRRGFNGISGIVTALMMALAILAGGGCAGTSAGFKQAAAQGGPFLADTTTQYVQKDTAIAPELKSERLAAADRLKAATADMKTIEVTAVETAWTEVKPTFLAYVNGDAGLSFRAVPTGPTLRDVIIMPATKMDTAISEENARRSKFHPFGG